MVKKLLLKASELKHTYIVNCKDVYKVGEYLKVKIKKIDLKNNIYELSAKNLKKTICQY